MGNLCKPPRRIHSERKCSKVKPNGYAFGGDVVVKREDRRGPDGQPLQTAPGGGGGRGGGALAAWKIDEGPMGNLCNPRRSRGGDEEEEEGGGAGGGGARRKRRRRSREQKQENPH